MKSDLEKNDYENQIGQLRQAIENNRMELSRLQDQILIKKGENENLLRQVDPFY